MVEVNPDTMEFTFTAYDVDEDGNWVNERDDTPKKEEMGRIAAQTFRQVMSQRIREAERDRKFEEYANREGDIVTGIIQQTDQRYTLLDLGRVESLLPQAEQVPFERPVPGDRVKAYIVEVRKTAKGPQIVGQPHAPGPRSSGCSSSRCPRSPTASSRSRPAPASQGTARRSPCGATTTTSTRSAPASAPVAVAVRMVVNELRGEKIDIVPYSEDLADYVAKALSPAKVKEVIISDDGTQADVIVPDHQLSLAIGKEGQNARLAARLTGVRIDIRGETPGARRPSTPRVDYEEGEWVANAESGEMEWHAADGSVMTQDQWNAPGCRRRRRSSCRRAAEPATPRRPGRVGGSGRAVASRTQGDGDNASRVIHARLPSGCASDAGIVAPKRSSFAARSGPTGPTVCRTSPGRGARGCARSIASTRPCDGGPSPAPGDATCRVPHSRRCGSR